ncbi:hypothetical protein ALP41_200004 [Pseudomonas savastanoi pv. nerii]|nr:hypothetical protein ALP41_200004 [Pseudomonas savastanoi pv. nerii]
MIWPLMQPLQCLYQWACCRIGIELDDTQQRRQKTRHSRLFGRQFGVKNIVWRTHQRTNIVQGLAQFVLSNSGIHSLA